MKKYIYISIFSLILWTCSSSGGDDMTSPPPPVNVAPTTPLLVYPTNNLLCIDNTLNFDWNASTDSNGDAITYTIQVSKDNQFTQIDFTATGSSTTHTFTLEKGIAYYWRVKATDSKNASSSYSSTYNLYTEGDGVSNHLPFAPELVIPSISFVEEESTTTLEWTASDVDNDALTFDVYLDTANPPTNKISENQSETTLNVDLNALTNYYWKVVVKDDKGGQTIGQVWNFSTDALTATIEGSYSGFYDFPNAFYDGANISKEQLVKVTDAQYLCLKDMHNNISPYNFAIIEYDPPAYGHTTPTGFALGDSAFPELNSGNHRWAVMGHEQGHNFFGGTSAFYGTLAFPHGPFLQESLAVLSALYTYHHMLANLETFGIEENTRNSLDVDFANERSYQEGQYDLYISQGSNFDMTSVLTSQALDYKMIVYGETYGWENFKKLAKAFQNNIGSQFTFQNDGVSELEVSTYIIAALSTSFGQDFRQDFLDLNFPIDDALYQVIHPLIQAYIN